VPLKIVPRAMLGTVFPNIYAVWNKTLCSLALLHERKKNLCAELLQQKWLSNLQ